MTYSNLEKFVKSPDKVDRYRQAIRLLEECGVREVLRELSSETILPQNLPNRMEVAASCHFESRGYQKCIYDLFTLEQLTAENKGRLQADFGAIDRMLSSGEITPEEAQTLRGNV